MAASSSKLRPNAGVLDLDDLPDPILVSNNIENENIFDMAKTQIEKKK